MFARPLAAVLIAAAFALPASAEEPKAVDPAPAEAPAAAAAPAQPTGDLVDGIAAQVGTEVVLVSDVDRVAAPIEVKIREQGATDADVVLLRSDVLDKLIERKMINLLAKRVEIEATDFEIDDAIANIAKENNLDAEGLKKSVESQGLSIEAYRKRIGDEIVQQKVLGGMVRSRVKIEDAEIRKVYDQRYAAIPPAAMKCTWSTWPRARMTASPSRSRRRATRFGVASRASARARASRSSRARCRRRAPTSAGFRPPRSHRGCSRRSGACNRVRYRA